MMTLDPKDNYLKQLILCKYRQGLDKVSINYSIATKLELIDHPTHTI